MGRSVTRLLLNILYFTTLFQKLRADVVQKFGMKKTLIMSN